MIGPCSSKSHHHSIDIWVDRALIRFCSDNELMLWWRWSGFAIARWRCRDNVMIMTEEHNNAITRWCDNDHAIVWFQDAHYRERWVFFALPSSFNRTIAQTQFETEMTSGREWMNILYIRNISCLVNKLDSRIIIRYDKLTPCLSVRQINI